MDIYLEAIENKKLDVLEACYNGLITLVEQDMLLSELDNKYTVYTEALEDVKNGIKNTTKKVMNSPVGKKAATGFTKGVEAGNNALNKVATVGASAIVKDPTKGGKVEVSNEVYEKYKKDMLKWRTRIKVAEIVTLGALAIGPIDDLFNVALTVAMARSNDPIDTAVKEKLKGLKDSLKTKTESLKAKVKALVDKVKAKKISEDELKTQLSNVETAGAAIAKQTDTIKSMKSVGKKPATVSEAVYNKMDAMFMESGRMTEKGYKILGMLIEKTNFEDIDLFPVACHYVGI